MAKLTDKQKRFVDFYLVSFNATQSAIDAGYSKKTANVIGCETLAKPYIQAYLKKAQEKTSKKLEVTRESQIAELEQIKGLALTPSGEYGNLELKTVISAIQEQNKMLGFLAPEKRSVDVTTNTVVSFAERD